MATHKNEVGRPPVPHYLVDSVGELITGANPIPVSTGAAIQTQVSSFTAAGAGMAVDASGRGLSSYSLQVVGLGATPTSWDVRLEGSIDNLNWTPLIQHTENSPNGSLVTSGPNIMLCLYARVKVAELTKGSATGIKVYMGYR